MKLKRLFIFALIIILLGILSVYWPQLTGKSVSNSNTEFQREIGIVTQVIDGDTIKAEINGIEYSIRLLGINNPKA